MLKSSSGTTATEAAPAGEMKTVAGKGEGRLANSAYRTRKHLEPAEVQAISEAARENRDGARDWLMILMTYRHGLRVGELCELRWTDVHLDTATLTVRLPEGLEGLDAAPSGGRAAGPAPPAPGGSGRERVCVPVRARRPFHHGRVPQGAQAGRCRARAPEREPPRAAPTAPGTFWRSAAPTPARFRTTWGTGTSGRRAVHRWQQRQVSGAVG
jgi:hypothetical protein